MDALPLVEPFDDVAHGVVVERLIQLVRHVTDVRRGEDATARSVMDRSAQVAQQCECRYRRRQSFLHQAQRAKPSYSQLDQAKY